MKRYLKNFDLTYEFVKSSIYDCLNQQRWKRRDTAFMLADFMQLYMYENNQPLQNKKQLVKKIQRFAYSDKTKLFKLVDYMSLKVYEEICNRKISLEPIRYEERIDGISKKVREIGISSMKQQLYDYIIVNACKEMFNAKIGHYQCASIPLKGQVFGKGAIETWIRTNPKQCRYIFKADIKKFYPSVDHTILKELLARDIKNDTLLYILYTLIDTYKEGLCIGSYLCQYLANYVLSYPYHYVSEMLYTERRGKRINLINHVLFYMDDVILFGSSKKNVKLAAKKLEKYLNDKLNLGFKPTYQLFPLDSRPIDMMGFKIYTYKTTVRKRIFNKANKTFKKAKKNMTLKQAYRVVSYNGYFRNSYSYKYIKKTNLDNTLKKAKEVISNANRKVY